MVFSEAQILTINLNSSVGEQITNSTDIDLIIFLPVVVEV